jgi:hypothetical protein
MPNQFDLGIFRKVGARFFGTLTFNCNLSRKDKRLRFPGCGGQPVFDYEFVQAGAGHCSTYFVRVRR